MRNPPMNARARLHEERRSVEEEHVLALLAIAEAIEKLAGELSWIRGISEAIGGLDRTLASPEPWNLQVEVKP